MNHEAKLMIALHFMVEFIRRVIENGNGFDEHHFAILLLNLQPEHINSSLAEFIRIVMKHLKIGREAVDSLMEQLHEGELKEALLSVYADLIH
jgi:hypothetical protein